MTDDKAKITITYQPDDQDAEVRCDYPGDNPDDRDERVRDLFKAVLQATSEELEKEDIHAIGGGEVTGPENAVLHAFGTEDDIPMA